MQRSLTERLARSRLQWAGHVERMTDDRLPKRAAELCEQGRRRRGRPRPRREDCVKRDVRKAGEEEDLFRVSSYQIRSLTQSVGAMLWSMAQLRRGQLRMVVCVVGSF